MQRLKVYQVMENADSVEGRGPMVHVAYFKHLDDAQIIAVPIWGAEVRDTDLVIFDSLSEYKEHTIGEAKMKALAKLSTENKKALGLL